MTTKQRAYLKSLASTMDPIFQVGKAGAAPELVNALDDALEKRELIKINVLNNCADDLRDYRQPNPFSGSAGNRAADRIISSFQKAADSTASIMNDARLL